MRTHGKKVIVKQQLSKLETEGGIALPENTQQKLPVGEVIQVGDEVTLTVVKGDLVQFNGYSGASITVRGQDYLVLDQDDILVTLEDGEYE